MYFWEVRKDRTPVPHDLLSIALQYNLIETNSKDNGFLFFSDFNYLCHPQCCLKINETNMNETLDK